MSKEYTLEEVQQHNKEGDIWVVWRDGLILDVSQFQKVPRPSFLLILEDLLYLIPIFL